MISAGRVAINGVTAILGAQVDTHSVVTLDNRPISDVPELRYYRFHKPIGYVCSRKAQGDNPTIYELLPADMSALKPVGRLDKDSSGLLLLTNDGDYAHSMTHPSFHKVKQYEVSLNKSLEPLHQQIISDYGVEIGDGASKLSLERRDDGRIEWLVTMSEGRNRQIRRTFAALGYEVTRLHRTTFGPVVLGELPPKSFEQIPAPV
jgi:23S rRNA pseudouridine2605 synthase